jgi:type IV pilus assembly protein PilC
LSAASEDSATDLLDYVGYRVVNLRKYVPVISFDKLRSRFSQVKTTEIILFYRQLALLLESGIDIITSLELLRGQTSNGTLNRVLADVIAEVRGGNQLSAAMEKHPKIFSTICRRSLRVGEQTGGLEIILRQVADYMEKEISASKGIKNALTYPIIAAVATVVVVGILVGFVLPAFGTLYSSLGTELPLITRMLLSLSAQFRVHGLKILLGILILAGSIYIYIRTPKGKFKWAKLALTMPLFGRINHLKELARCCRSISLLFRAGLPLTEIMPLVIDGVNNAVIVEALTNVQQDMLKGEGLSQPMTKNEIFLPMMVQMVKVGEETGNLDTTLMAVAQNYEAEAQDKTDAIIRLIQPTMTLLIGVVIALIALSMVSAMYSLYGQME